MLIVEIACRDEEEAKKLASTLVREKLAACANVIPGVTSYFYWDGFTGEREALILLKTMESKRGAVEKRVKQLNSYKCPAIVSWKANVNKDYEKWAKKALGRKK